MFSSLGEIVFHCVKIYFPVFTNRAKESVKITFPKNAFRSIEHSLGENPEPESNYFSRRSYMMCEIT